MLATIHKSIRCMGTILLCLGHLAVLGLQFYYKAQQVPPLPPSLTYHLSNTPALTGMRPYSRQGWRHAQSLLLDKRFSLQQVFCFSAPFFSLALTEESIQQLFPCKRIHARASFDIQCLRGPPSEAAV